MAKAKTSAKAQTKNMTSEILDRLDQLEALVPPDAVQHALHRISTLEEAICPKVAARLSALERNVGERGEMPLPLFDCVRMQGQENRAIHERFEWLHKQSVPEGTGPSFTGFTGKGREDAKPAIPPRAVRVARAIRQKFGIDFTPRGVDELLSTIGAIS